VIQNDSKFDLVTINPVVVFGAEDGTSVNQSNKILQGVLEGEYPALMDLAWAIVDVRDVATAHVEALEREGAEGRHLCGNVTLRMHELVTMIRDQFPDHAGNLPTMDLSGKFGNCIAKIAANFQPKPVKSFLKTNLGRPIEIDNSKIKSSLAMDFIPAEETIRETVQSLIDRGLVPKAQAKADKAAAKSKKGKSDDDDKGKDAAEANSK
jgi:dihydroflavonol-4-reductase